MTRILISLWYATNQGFRFLYEIGSLRNMDRGWKQHFGMETASIMEHTMRVMWLALILAKRETGADESKIIRMALAHDLAESRTLDFSYIQKVYVEPDETKAVHDALVDTGVEDFELIVDEYKKRDTLEAKIVKDADNLDVDLELKELEERGSQLPVKWKAFRRRVRDEKLYTESAKKLWDDIQESDPATWHMSANKWLKIPDAGT